eukprot:comp12293_c0_seq1/m.7126 comp12293_c0_seq1/g.7126  ORF comp12293_c0_seq1/g.7126 comp12293_c0_seq1/m.7126 type:complete len:385 (-) comp12293_c0_seq1:398-1552(-)
MLHTAAVVLATLASLGDGKPARRGACPIDVGGTCFTSLADAVKGAPDGSTVTIKESLTVTKEVSVDKNLEFVGENGVTITANLAGGDKAGTILRGVSSGIIVTIKNINFVNKGGWASVLRSPELGTGEAPETPKVGPVNLIMDGCSISKFRTASRGGAAIALGWVDKVEITNTKFTNNLVDPDADEYIRPQWDGAGAIWIYNAFGDITVTGCTFNKNRNVYGHGLGAGMGITFLEGTLTVKSTFTNNVANSGAGILVTNIPKGSVVNIDGTFKNNEARNNGWNKGARGGAVWLQNIWGVANIKGLYENNLCSEGRGGAFANNRIYSGGVVNFGGSYANNKAVSGASVWDTLYEYSGKFNNNAKIANSNPMPQIRLQNSNYNPEE